MLAQPLAAAGPSVMSLASLLPAQAVAVPYAMPMGPDVVSSAPPERSVESSKTPEPASQEVGTGRRAMRVAMPQPMADASMPSAAPMLPMTMIDMLTPPPRPMPVMAQEKPQNDTVMVPQVMPPAPQVMPPAPQVMPPASPSGPELLSPPLPVVAVLPPAMKMPEVRNNHL
jgi:hypothetical protein